MNKKPLPTTRKGCWAKDVSQCGEGISREHIVSKSLFSDSVYIRGFEWCKKDLKKIGINKFVTKCLCKKHNQELSELDQAAADLWNMLQEYFKLSKIRNGIKRKTWGVKKCRIDATRIERWCFKTMLNMLSSEGYKSVGEWTPSLELVRFIFGEASLPEDYGLGIVAEVSQKISNAEHVSFSPLFRKDKFIGCMIGFRGMQIACSFAVKVKDIVLPSAITPGASSLRVLYHLEKIHHASANLILELDWSGKFDNGKDPFILQIRTKYFKD